MLDIKVGNGVSYDLAYNYVSGTSNYVSCDSYSFVNGVCINSDGAVVIPPGRRGGGRVLLAGVEIEFKCEVVANQGGGRGGGWNTTFTFPDAPWPMFRATDQGKVYGISHGAFGVLIIG